MNIKELALQTDARVFPRLLEERRSVRPFKVERTKMFLQLVDLPRIKLIESR